MTYVPLDFKKATTTFSTSWVWHSLVLTSIGGFSFLTLISGQTQKKGVKMTILKSTPFFQSHAKRNQIKETPKTLVTIKKMKAEAKMNFRQENTSNNKASQKVSIKNTAEKFEYESSNNPNRLELIRNDPRRIYLDKNIVVGDLTFSIRNVSEHGMEFHVENNVSSNKTYYFPKVESDGNVSVFSGTIIPPSGSTYGCLVIPNLRQKNNVNLKFSSVGGVTRSEKVKLEW